MRKVRCGRSRPVAWLTGHPLSQVPQVQHISMSAFEDTAISRQEAQSGSMGEEKSDPGKGVLDAPASAMVNGGKVMVDPFRSPRLNWPARWVYLQHSRQWRLPNPGSGVHGRACLAVYALSPTRIIRDNYLKNKYFFILNFEFLLRPYGWSPDEVLLKLGAR
jgi:hypothetical protein